MDTLARAKHYMLHLLIKKKEMYLDDLQNNLIYAFERLLSVKEINKMIMRLHKAGLIEISEAETDEYKQCVNEYNNKKTVKNPRIHCKKKHPIDIVVRATADGLIAYAQSVYCLSLALDNTRTTALENMRMVAKELGIQVPQPPDCSHIPA